MATKVKPCRIKATGTPQVGYVPKYVDEDTFQRGTGGGGDVVVSSQAHNLLTTGMKIWCGTEGDYANLGTYDSNSLYLTVPGSATPSLPAEYQEVEWIGSSGTQWIDTGMAFTNNTKVNIDLAFDSRDSWRGVIGCQYQNVNQSWAIGIGTSAFTYQQSTLSKDITWQPTIDQKYNFTTDGNDIYRDGTLIGTISGTISTFTTPANGTICKVNYTDSTGFSGNFPGKVYGCKIYEGATLERDFVPCYRKLDSVIGMYDLVNDTFYTNAGSGTFTKGSDV